MGVPKFFRWISVRYPFINAVVSEQEVPIIDHFYLDMNGILHTCSHPDGSYERFSEETIFLNIRNYIQFLVQLIKPRKTLFLAVDGVAPRAKMTQQRARRFQAAQEAREAKEKAERQHTHVHKESFDPCLISPGTAFMERLHTYLKKFVEDQVQHNDIWRHIDVVYSGHDCPGEGEHKIREYMSYKRTQPDYEPNACHCIYGMDADLIFLGLTTHEVNVCILRENVVKARTCIADQTPFCITYLSLLREYIDCEFQQLKTSLTFPYDLERIIDDWVFMAFLLGNDFIPHIPNLHIHAESLPVLWDTYHVVLPRLDGYLVEYGRLNLARFHQYLEELSKFEQSWFEEREADYRWMRGKRGAKLAHELENLGKLETVDHSNSAVVESEPLPASEISQLAAFTHLFAPESNSQYDAECLDEAAELLAEGVISPTHNLLKSDSGCVQSNFPTPINWNNIDDDNEEDIDEDVLIYRMHRRDYYWTKLNIPSASEDELSRLVLPLVTDYIRMLQWILCYYFLRVSDWDFFYPYHYAPFANDLLLYTKQFVNSWSDDADLSWANFASDSVPVLPFVQQLLILPMDSAYMVPKCYQPLMTSPYSPLAPYFPRTFATDINGKIASWEAVVLIPFVDYSVLKAALSSVEENFTSEEIARNKHKDHLFYPAVPFNDADASSRCVSLAYPHTFYRDRVMLAKDELRQFYDRPGRMANPWFPNLSGVSFTMDIRRIPVHIFETPSRLESMALIINRPQLDLTALESIAVSILGRPVRVRWPQCAVVLPVRVMTSSYIFELRNFNLTPSENELERLRCSESVTMRAVKTEKDASSTVSEFDWFRNCVDSLERTLRTRRALLFRSADEQSHATNSAVLVFSRRFEGWSVRHVSSSQAADQFLLTPYFEQAQATTGFELKMNSDSPGTGWFNVAPTLPRGRGRRNRLGLPSLTIEPCYKLCDGLTVDLLDLAIIGQPPRVPLGHIIAGWDSKELLPLDKLFHPGLVVFMMEPPLAGFAGEVAGVQASEHKVLVRPYPDTGHALDLSDLKKRLTSSPDACNMTTSQVAFESGLHPAVVSRLTGIVLVDASDYAVSSSPNQLPTVRNETANRSKERKPMFNIGLNLKHNKTRSQVLGWSRFCPERSTWLFSPQTAALLRSLSLRFHHIWRTLSDFLLSSPDRGSRSLHLPRDELERFVACVEESGCRSAPVVPSGGSFLDSSMVQRVKCLLTSSVCQTAKSALEHKPGRTIQSEAAVVTCSPESLFVPLTPAHSLNPNLKSCTPSTTKSDNHERRFELLDRVVFIKPDQTVPLGLFGTVIGITSNTPSCSVEVMFDKEFAGAEDRRGSGPRCALVNPSMLLSVPSAHHTCQTKRSSHDVDSNPSTVSASESNDRTQITGSSQQPHLNRSSSGNTNASCSSVPLDPDCSNQPRRTPYTVKPRKNTHRTETVCSAPQRDRCKGLSDKIPPPANLLDVKSGNDLTEACDRLKALLLDPTCSVNVSLQESLPKDPQASFHPSTGSDFPVQSGKWQRPKTAYQHDHSFHPRGRRRTKTDSFRSRDRKHTTRANHPFSASHVPDPAHIRTTENADRGSSPKPANLSFYRDHYADTILALKKQSRPRESGQSHVHHAEQVSGATHAGETSSPTVREEKGRFFIPPQVLRHQPE